MKSIKNVLLALILGISVFSMGQLAFSPPAYAGLFDGSKSQACQGTQVSDTGGCAAGQETKINNLIATVINILSVIVGIAAVIMIIINGFRFVTSGGDSNAVGNAKRGIIYAMVGLAIVAIAQFIVYFVLNETGDAFNPPPTP